MADGDSGGQAQIDGLYGLPLEEFTAARNQLAQQLRRAGERERGEQVKGLRKPSLAAWTLNQLRRRQPELVDGLLDAGLQLREAQERLLGEGERGRLRAASAEERQLVDQAVQAAEAVLRDAGHAVSAAVHHKLWETTHAAAVDPELGETLRRGRLVEDRQISDLGLFRGMGPAATASSGSAEPAPAKPSSKNRRRLEQARQRKQTLEKKLESVRQTAAEADDELARARTVLQSAEAAAARAQSVARRAQAAVEQARERVREAADRVETLEADTR